MIFLTVGTQLGFDRLVKAVDAWAERRGGGAIFGQIAEPGETGYRPRHFEWVPHLDPPEFQARFDAAEGVVGHAGMGTIISALSQAKPLLIMPRRAELKEQRNDHQLATAEQFGVKAGITVAHTDAEVAAGLDALAAGQGAGANPIGPFADASLIDAVRAAIHGR